MEYQPASLLVQLKSNGHVKKNCATLIQSIRPARQQMHKHVQALFKVFFEGSFCLRLEKDSKTYQGP